MSHNRSGGGRSKGFNFGSFEMKRGSGGHSMHAVPPPATVSDGSTGHGNRGRNSDVGPSSASGVQVSRQGYSTLSAISQSALAVNWGAMGRKRIKTEDEYFDEDDEPPTPSLAYIPAPGSPTNDKKQNDSSDEEDTLDAFMAGLEKQSKKDDLKNKSKKDAGRGTRGDIEEEDDEETYYKYMEENPLSNAQNDGSDVEIEYDEDGNPIPPPKKKYIDPLPPMDHSEINYEPFEKNFYTPHEDIINLTSDKIEELKKVLGIKITGAQPPNPVSSFMHFGFDDALMKSIRKAEYFQPTPIQTSGIPVVLSGRDLIGIARTGSGKTAAYLWPLLIHIMDQKELKTGDGPIGLILAPTRELAQQIYSEAKRFGKVYNIQCICCYGGGSKWEQSKALEGSGAEIVVATPGRMIDMVKIKATNLQRVTYLVIDEADRMFDLGFEGQVRSICGHVRPDRQTLLFSATFPRRVEKLARDVLRDPVRVQHGDAGEANTDVCQFVRIYKTQQQKWDWLLTNLVEFTSTGSILIFVTKKLDAEQVAGNLSIQQHDVLLLHGDMDQIERNKVITSFKKRESNILVATDVAARGLDIPHIRTVVNYDVARDIDTHTHRIGRTGRAGVQGDAITLLLVDKDKDFAGHLVRNFEGANQEVPQELLDMAMQSSWFRKSRFKAGKGKNLNIGGCGLGYKERPGLQPVSEETSVSDIAVSEAKKGGPATDRLAAMKAAFKMQYSQFTVSSESSLQKTQSKAERSKECDNRNNKKSKDDNCFAVPLPPPPLPGNPHNTAKADRVRKSGKKSRWE